MVEAIAFPHIWALGHLCAVVHTYLIEHNTCMCVQTWLHLDAGMKNFFSLNLFACMCAGGARCVDCMWSCE